MKRLLILTFALLVSLSLFGRPKENPRITDERITDHILGQLRDAGYTVLPEVIVQDTLNRGKQKFSSRYETKGGRGMMMPKWANDSTWSPGMKEPKKEWDDLYFNPRTDRQRYRSQVDQIIDTLVKDNPNITVNYYNNDPFFYSHNISRFYHGGFNYWMYNDMWSYGNYWMMDMDDWYWVSRFSVYPYWPYSSFYFADRYSYWGWNSWMYNPWRFNYYGFNNHYNNYYTNNFNHSQNTSQYGHRERPSNFTQSDRRFETPQRNRIEPPQTRPMYSESRRPYTPSYENPRMSTRPNFNNSRVNNMNMENRRGNMNGQMNGNMRNTQNRGMNSGNSNMRNMPNSRREVTPQSRIYTPTPNRESSNPSRSYSEPTRNFNSSGMDRRSGSLDFSNVNNSGAGSGRSSSGSSSSGSSNSSAGSGTGRR